jgi:hypothetical protein
VRAEVAGTLLSLIVLGCSSDGTVAGVVRDGDTPVAGVQVALKNGFSDKSPLIVETDAAGRFLARGVHWTDTGVLEVEFPARGAKYCDGPHRREARVESDRVHVTRRFELPPKASIGVNVDVRCAFRDFDPQKFAALAAQPGSATGFDRHASGKVVIVSGNSIVSSQADLPDSLRATDTNEVMTVVVLGDTKSAQIGYYRSASAPLDISRPAYQTLLDVFLVDARTGEIYHHEQLRGDRPPESVSADAIPTRFGATGDAPTETTLLRFVTTLPRQ